MKTIWLDDLRDPTTFGWREFIRDIAPQATEVVWVKSYDEFVATVSVLAPGEVYAVFFDNDLGPGKQGKHAFNWFEEWVRTVGHPEVILYAQTSNPSARKELRLGFEALRRWWTSR